MTDLCNCNSVDKLEVEKAKKLIPPEKDINILADFFKVFGDETRLKILSTLVNGRHCVCDLSEIIGMTHSATSHQLRILRNARIVKVEKVGKQCFYSLDDQHVSDIFQCGLNHINEH